MKFNLTDESREEKLFAFRNDNVCFMLRDHT